MRPVPRIGLVCLTVAAALVSPASAERPPNEPGSVMLLEYHRIGEPEGRWTRSPTHFRDDLERLWSAGYRAVALDAFVTGSIDLPAGTSPVVLTFDDSSPGQFRYLERIIDGETRDERASHARSVAERDQTLMTARRSGISPRRQRVSIFLGCLDSSWSCPHAADLDKTAGAVLA
jgi:hypothetical protein